MGMVTQEIANVILSLRYWWVALPALVVIIMLYRPPGELSGLRDILDRHFGDVIGLYILHLGIILVVIGVFYPQAATAVQRIGESLIMASMIALKLKTVPGANGNGDVPSEKVITQTETTRVTVGSPPAAGGL
jgi:hypothetical protein